MVHYDKDSKCIVVRSNVVTRTLDRFFDRWICLVPDEREAIISPLRHDFGYTMIGLASAPQTFTITNTGQMTANINVSLQPDPNVGIGEVTDTTQYQLTGGGAMTLTMGQSKTVSVVFNPTIAVTDKKVRVLLRVDCPDCAIQTIDARISGTAVTRITLRIDPASYNFGEKPMGSSTIKAYNIYNDGGIAATVQLTVTGAATGDKDNFQVTDDGLTFNIAAKYYRIINVTFMPIATGTKQITLKAKCMSCSPQIEATATAIGGGITRPVIGIDPSSKDFGSVEVQTAA